MVRLHVRSLYTDEQLWLIGVIATHWASIEQFMDSQIAMLAKALKVANPLDHDSLSFKRGVRSWRDLIRQSPAPPERIAAIERLIDRVAEAQHDRHSYVHGALGAHPQLGNQVMRMLPERLAYSKPADTDILAAVAEKLDSLLFDLVVLLSARSGDKEPPPELAGLLK